MINRLTYALWFMAFVITVTQGGDLPYGYPETKRSKLCINTNWSRYVHLKSFSVQSLFDVPKKILDQLWIFGCYIFCFLLN